MRVILIISLLSITLLSVSCFADKKAEVDSLTIDWHPRIESALELAQQENKPVFVLFTGSDWCYWCMTLNKEVLTQQEFIKYAQENLFMVKLDFPKKIEQTEETIAYNNYKHSYYNIRGVPTVVLLSSSGDEIGRTGYQKGGALAYIQHLESILP
ncbi:MAG: thioredoxin family protein [Candidatus Cloacimonetes bacterium]|nr:thioredoxin family protein [Candidatus Cloacimonadota bacterium]